MKKKIVGLSIFMLLVGTFIVVTPDMVSADYWENGFFYTVSDNLATVTGYNGIGGAITIPSTLGGYQTVAIGDAAFARKTSLTSVNIPSSITSIGAYAFSTCYLINSVILSDGLISIGAYAFYETALCALTIPRSVTTIGNCAFFYCISLSTIYVDPNNSYYASRDGVLYDKTITTLIQYPCGKAGMYTIPNSVITIKNDAFNLCTLLTSVTIPNSVKTIERTAFDRCSSLTSVTIPNSVTTIESGAFIFCTSLNSVTIENGVITIGDIVFAHCRSLISMFIPNSVTTIGAKAFFNCGSLSSITIGNGVSAIGFIAFYNCSSLSAIYIDPDNAYYASRDGVLYDKTITTLIQYPCGKAGMYTIPNSVSTIVRQAFVYCTLLTSVTIPDKVTTIEDQTFALCTSLYSVTFGSGVSFIRDFTFIGCSNLISITFLGRNTPIDVGDNWILNTHPEIRGHAFPSSNFPIPGEQFHGLIMGAFLNEPPTADFTFSPIAPTDLDVIHFTDTSTDADGTIVSWNWDFDDGGTSTLQNPTHDYADDERYHVVLTVTDDDGASDSISNDVLVFDAPPTADFTFSPIAPTDLDVIHFTDTSIDSDGTIVSWNWDFDDGVTSTLQNPTHDYADDGTYTVNLSVCDDDGECRNMSKDVIVSNVVPVADAGGPYIDIEDSPVELSAAGSSDPDGVIVEYRWDFTNDGSYDTDWIPTPTTTHIYDKKGNYVVRVEVKDDDGATSTDTAGVMINRGNAPTVHMIYPVGGETVKDTITIQWSAYDIEDGDNLPIYLYYSGDKGQSWARLVLHSLANTGAYSWDTTTLPDGGDNVVMVVAQDSIGNVGSDSSASFQIKNHEEPPENHAPDQPSIPSGTTNGRIGREYAYTTSTTDSDGDQVFYLFDWGDDTNSGWLGPYNSGVTGEAEHIWNARDNYNIKVKAKDVYGKESSWSDPLPITMPYSYNRPILQLLDWLFQRFPNAFPILRQLMGY